MLDNKTGRILAMAGGFSYPLSQLNRATQSQRQPGSSIKPLTYLAALRSGLQPNTLVRDQPITLAADRQSAQRAGAGLLVAEELLTVTAAASPTLRRALENSTQPRHRAPAGGRHRRESPKPSLDRVCQLALEAQIYQRLRRAIIPSCSAPSRCGSIDLAAFYAAIANEGAASGPLCDRIRSSRTARSIYPTSPQLKLDRVGATGRRSIQLKTMMQGVVARGTARAIAQLSPYVAGKTGTTRRRK